MVNKGKRKSKGKKNTIDVSIVTPTYNRRTFIPYIRKMILEQTYPISKIEWIIYDDGTEPIKDLVEDLPFVRYFKSEKKVILGAKRNFLNEKAKGKYIVCMDDDDYYPPERVEYAVNALKSSQCMLAGTSKLHIYYIDKNIMNISGPFNPYHACNGSLAFKKEYTLHHKYIDTKERGEEPGFLNNFSEPLIQLNSEKTMICIAHSTNTVDKNFYQPCDRPVTDFIQNPEFLDFYKSLSLVQPITKHIINNNVQLLIRESKVGCTLENIEGLYFNRFGRRLEYKQFGYTSIGELLQSIEGVSQSSNEIPVDLSTAKITREILLYKIRLLMSEGSINAGELLHKYKQRYGVDIEYEQLGFKSFSEYIHSEPCFSCG